MKNIKLKQLKRNNKNKKNLLNVNLKLLKK